MADLSELEADLLSVMDLAIERPETGGVILAFGSTLALNRHSGRAAASEPADAFEAWLIERWLREVRSEAFQASAEFEYLRAEWERGA